MKNSLFGVRSGLAAALAFGLSHAAFAATDLTVYTAVEAEDLKKYAARFNEDHPDIKINWVRDSTGIGPQSCWRRKKIRARMSYGAWRPPVCC